MSMSSEKFLLMQTRLNNLVAELYNKADGQTDSSLSRNDKIISDPSEIDIILRNPDIFKKNFSLISLLGESRFTMNGANWKLRRDVTQESYTMAIREPYSQKIFEIFEDEIGKIEELSIANINFAIIHASMNVFLQSFKCLSNPTRFVNFVVKLRRLLVSLQYHSWFGASDNVLKELNQQAQLYLSEFVSLLEDDKATFSLLNLFMQRLNTSDKTQAAQELLMNMFAGVETSTASVGWIMNRLGVNEMIQERLYKELTNSPDDHSYRNCFINETLRFFPPIPFVIRSLEQDFDLNGRKLHADQQIVISIIGAHHDRASWIEPHIFNSARPEFLCNSFNRKAFIPYISGPRTCGGIRIAGLEISAALDILLKSFSFSNPQADVAFDYSLALRPKFDGAFSISRR